MGNKYKQVGINICRDVGQVGFAAKHLGAIVADPVDGVVQLETLPPESEGLCDDDSTCLLPNR